MNNKMMYVLKFLPFKIVVSFISMEKRKKSILSPINKK